MGDVKENSVRLVTWIPAADKAALDAYASRTGATRSASIALAVRQFLDRQKWKGSVLTIGEPPAWIQERMERGENIPVRYERNEHGALRMVPVNPEEGKG